MNEINRQEEVEEMMYFSFDPERDYDRYDREQQAHLDSLPVCAECGEPIQQETALYWNSKWYCDDCEQELWHHIREGLWKKVMPSD